MQEKIPLIHRDISWLSFNERVLQEAKDPKVPLLERVKFLAIYSSNLGEFFKVRMANHLNLVRLNKKTKKQLDYSPKRIIKEITRIVNKQQIEFSRIFQEEIIPELRANNIFIKRQIELNTEQNIFIENYFHEHLLLYAQPLLMKKNKVRPFLKNGSLYLAIILKDKENSNQPHEFGILEIPSNDLPRFIELPSPSGEHHLIMLDDVVRHSIAWMFPGYNIVDSFSFKLTRDAELYIDNEFSGNLKDKIRKSLAKRQIGPPARFVYDREMPEELLDFLSIAFELKKYDMIKEGRYHNNFDFFKFPDFGKTELLNQKLSPLTYEPLENTNNYFQAIKKSDHLIHVPYHTYESVVRFFEEAANDPKVTHIKIVQYRVAQKSRIMDALMKAASLGKQVSVFVEVKARFDEKANLEWGEKLEAAGVKVQYSFPGVKVHSKLALVRRLEGNTPTIYTYLGTGNFHEDTAKVYSDLGLFTANKKLTSEVQNVFSYLENKENVPPKFNHLLVGQFNLREDLVQMVNNEIENAKRGKQASIILKMNSLQDKEMIKKLYEASQVGVKIKLIVRGICCLVPNQIGYSENIEVISIVDRYLEHARVFIFHNNGREKMYLSSADWMQRNLSYRVETAFPIYDKSIRNQINELIQIQLGDNTKARIIDENQINAYHRNDTPIPIQSQLETYQYLFEKLKIGVMDIIKTNNTVISLSIL